MKIRSLQALRALAALMVVVHHGQHETAALAERTQRPFTPSALLPWDAGVDLFFVISGFIIVYAAGPLYGSAGARRRFLAHRVARVVPLYWLVTTAYLAVALAVPGLLSGDVGADRLAPAYVAASFLFWPMARPDGTAQPLLGLGWTLNYEMFFYLLFAIGLGRGRRTAMTWLLASLVVLAAARVVYPAMPMPLAFWTSPILLEFAFGALLALAREGGLRLPLGLRILVFGLGLACLAAASMWEPAWHALALGLPATMIVASAALGSGDGRFWSSGAGRAVTAFGDASYALYLTHPFVLRAGREALLRLGLAPSLGLWTSLAGLVAVAGLASLAVYRLVERPLSSRARVLLDPASRRPAAIGCETSGGTTKTLDEAAHHVPERAKRV